MSDENAARRQSTRVSPLLRKLLRRQGTRQARGRASRWLAWAEGLEERLRRMLPYCHGPGMVLAQPFVWVRQLRERWFLRAQFLRPQIHLAIQPLLRETFRVFVGEGHSAPQRASLPQDSSAARSEPLEVAATRGLEPGATPLALPPLSLVFQRTNDGRAIIRLDALDRSRPPDTRAQLPLDRVFRRNASPAPEEEVEHSGTRTLVDRIIRRTQRLEEHIGPTNCIAQKTLRQTEAGQARSVPAMGETNETFVADPRRAGWKQAPVQSPSVNVEALADQVLQRIDRRVTAWRERSGKRS